MRVNIIFVYKHYHTWTESGNQGNRKETSSGLELIESPLNFISEGLPFSIMICSLFLKLGVRNSKGPAYWNLAMKII